MSAPSCAKSGSATSSRAVSQARDIQTRRLAGRINATATPTELAEHARPNDKGRRSLAHAVTAMGLTARGYDRVLRVARTIADLDGEPHVNEDHVAEALCFRMQRAHENEAALTTTFTASL